LILLAAGVAAVLWLAFQQNVGANFVLLLLLAVVLFVPLPLLAYRGYALLTARYSVERDGLRLRWGLRAEDIPLPEIEWVRPASDLAFDLPVPRLSWPGAILGSLNVSDLGPVEFMASDRALLLLLATPTRVYAISPADPVGFVRAFQYATEMGSLSPIESYSARPASYLRSVWDDRLARTMLLLGAGLTVVLFVLVSLYIPGLDSVSLGFSSSGQLLPPVPAAQLLLLPLLGGFAFLMDTLAGAYFYRYDPWRPVAYLMWASSTLTPALLIAAVFFLL
jgi:hypothetical protein